MKKSILVGIILLIGIAITFYNKQEGISQQVTVEQMELKEEEIQLYVQEEVIIAPYEPQEGVYLGAYVEKNLNLDHDIKKFEEVLGQKQAFRVFQYTDTNRVYTSDILKCMANRQVPYIKLMMDKNGDMTSVYRLIGDIKSSYSTPIFIELFPVTTRIEDPVTYKNYYEEAYKIIKKYISNAVVVWSCDLEKIEESILYYPGNHLVDWVGVNIYLPQYKDGIAYKPDIKSGIDFWYKNFQDKKPLMISSLAVSYFSRYDHTYAIEDAKKKLNLFYEEIVHTYPRLKAILYVDVDMKEINEVGMEDYRISAHSQITKHMTKILADGVFLHEIENKELKDRKEYLKYTVPVVENKGKYYLPEEYARDIFHHIKFKTIEAIQDLNGKLYYSLNQLLNQTNAYYNK